ncbi:C6 transcription factor, putative [Talaromyces stipitatus ATCC 10500]|uniref:C6 transcription factor, putative n=1 Tax=Talaromyces stipitatus (strain ATCC 10500 / CBS 375.48 / QM 6759 / NRRL 1006) TaxID=441959 RepID=B8MRF5_TALSN|nr:C6 transcription factor, putative [Talaromyces stipitatus ATCC 10500]EED13092.1 C6 transcription factor, putative [Talaromyces stipitatus ATCC 10500]
MSRNINTLEEASSPEAGGFRTRRSHKKSRYGCTKCKKRRIKCDERLPKCSRCERMDLSCQYPNWNPKSILADVFMVDSLDVLPLQHKSRAKYGRGSPANSNHSFGISGSPLSSVSNLASSQLSTVLPKQDRNLDSALLSKAAQDLTPVEFELFQHYLDHTSKDLTVGDEEQNTLQIRIPTLACESKPLMKSVLALSEVCKCLDIINQLSASDAGRNQVIELLSLANRYHMDSLRAVQATLPQTKHYDHVLANAAMMGMYGSGSHCARIWLAKTASLGDRLQEDLLPRHSQWIRLFRAVHMAYGGLLNNSQSTDTAQFDWDRSPNLPTAGNDSRIRSYFRASSQLQQQRPPINHALYPIISATVGPSMEKLRRRTREIAILEASSEISGYDSPLTLSIHGNPEIEACFVALSILGSIVTETFPTNDSMASTPLAFEVDVDPVGQLSEVSPWLRRYAASITSMVPSPLPRRFIMAFIHKVPNKYLNLIEDMLNLIQTDAPVGHGMVWTPEPSPAHQLALDIFAHWLVLVLMLDNVWWIGDIGAWELGQIASFRNDARQPMWLWNQEEDWWPGSMLEISRQFEKHRTKS